MRARKKHERKMMPSGTDQRDENLKGQRHEQSDRGCRSPEGLRSTSSKTATETWYTAGTGSLDHPDSSDDSSKKKKKEKKKKSSEKKKKKSKSKKDKDKESDKKKKKKTNRKEMMLVDDDNESTVTKCDEKLVEELCSFLSNTLCTDSDTESFLRLLKENSEQGRDGPHPQAANDGAEYGFLESPAPSLCESYASRFSTLSTMQSVLGGGRPDWTALKAPSISSVASSNRSQLKSTMPGPSIKGPARQFSQKRTVESAEMMSPLESITISLKGPKLRKAVNRSSAVGPKLENTPKSLSQSRHPRTVSGGSNSERRTSSDKEAAVSAFEGTTPEDLFNALPQEFHMYLVSLYSEELQTPPTKEIANGRNNDFLMSCAQSNIPLETRGDRDALSVVSDLSALTGMVSYASKSMPVLQGNIYASYIPESTSDSEDSDDESQSSDPHLPAPSIASHFHDHHRLPRRSSVCSGMAKTNVRKVSFQFVHIREFDTVLDCNPAVTEGPAIALGWTVITENMFLVSDYDDGRHRRYGDALMLSTHTREGILLRLGCSNAEIDAAVRRIQKAKNQRRRTAQQVRMDSLGFAMEVVGKRFRDLLTGGGGNSKSKVLGT